MIVHLFPEYKERNVRINGAAISEFANAAEADTRKPFLRKFDVETRARPFRRLGQFNTVDPSSVESGGIFV
jgi:hypothetical protein